MTNTKTTIAVISQTGKILSLFDISTGNRTGHLANLVAEPYELCLDRKRNVLFLTHAYRHGWYGSHGDDGHEISFIDCTRREVIDMINISPAKGPHYALLDETNDILYACVEGGLDGEVPNAGGIIGTDLSTRKVVKTIPSGYKTHWFVMTLDCRKAYCCNKDGGFISVLDLENERLLAKIDAPDGNEQPSISRDGRYAYFPSPTRTVGMVNGYADFRIQVTDTSTDEIVHSIPMKHQMLTTHITASGLLLAGQHLPSPERGRLAVLSGHEGGYQVLREVTVGRGLGTHPQQRGGQAGVRGWGV